MSDSVAPYYEALGVAEDATQEEIEQAYRLLIEYDASDSIRRQRISKGKKRRLDQELTEVRRFIERAYRCLADPTRRRNYDAFIWAGREAIKTAEPWRGL